MKTYNSKVVPLASDDRRQGKNAHGGRRTRHEHSCPDQKRVEAKQ